MAMPMARCGERFGRLVLFPLPLQGHISPMLQLATVLHSRGFSITIIHTHFNSPNPFNYPDFTFEAIKDGLSNVKASSQNLFFIISSLNVNCEVPFRNCLTSLMQQNPHEQILCIISDVALYFTQDVAKQVKLPRFILRTNSASGFLTMNAFPLLRQNGCYVPSQDPSFQALLPELHPLKDNGQPEIKTKAFPQLVIKAFEDMMTASGIIWNTFDYLEHSELAMVERVIPIPNFTLGPLHKLAGSSSSSLLMEDKSCITWLNKQASKSVLYVSFGSLSLMDEQELVETAWGLANSEQPFLWVVRPGSVHGSEWIELLPKGFEEMTSKRGRIVKWAPQEEVLAHNAVRGFWSHGGWNSTLESLCEGVPMLCRPCFEDQMLNSRYVCDVWKVGLKLEKGSRREEIERGIRRVMVEKEGEDMGIMAMDVKDEAKICLEKGGSSYESLEKLVDYLVMLVK